MRQLDLKGQVIYYRRSNSLEIQFIIAKALDMSSLVRREPGQFINRRDTAFLRQSIQSRSELDSVQHHTVEDDIVNAVARAIETFSRIDILVNAAGTDVPGALAQLSTRDWDHVLAVNLRAPFLLAKAVFPHMSQARRGTIITISSVAGKRGWANASAYCASKLGLTGLTQALAAEGKAHGIRACVVYPGAMATQWGLWSRQNAMPGLMKHSPRPKRFLQQRSPL